MKNNKCLIIGLVLCIIGISIQCYRNSYNKEEVHTYTCYKKYDTTSKGGHPYFYMILMSEQHYLFDITVTPSTYYSTNEGDLVTFKLNPIEFDPNYNKTKDFCLTIVVFILISVGVAFKLYYIISLSESINSIPELYY